MEENNPIPHILKDLHTWSTTDLALLITYLNRGVYQEFVTRITTAPQEDFEREWSTYKRMKDEIINSQRSLLQMEQHFNYRAKNIETIAIRKAAKEPIIIPMDGIERNMLHDILINPVVSDEKKDKIKKFLDKQKDGK